MLSSLRPITGLCIYSHSNNNINLYYFNNYYYARPKRHNYDIRHHFACYSAVSITLLYYFVKYTYNLFSSRYLHKGHD